MSNGGCALLVNFFTVFVVVTKISRTFAHTIGNLVADAIRCKGIR